MAGNHNHLHDHYDTHDHEHGHDHEHDLDHEHDDDLDHDHMHNHSHSHKHQHTHSHTHTKAVLNRLSRAIGHLESVKRMVEDGRDCSEVLIQLAAVRSAIGNTAKIVLKDHIEHCIVEAVESNDSNALDELNKAIERFMQ